VTVTGTPTTIEAPVAQLAPVVEATEFNAPELVAVASKKYEVDLNLALKIARCESNLRQFNAKTGQVLRGRQNSADVGIFQINERYHLKQSKDLGYDIYKAGDNVEYAMYLLDKDGSRHWKASQKCWGK